LFALTAKQASGFTGLGRVAVLVVTVAAKLSRQMASRLWMRVERLETQYIKKER